MMRKDGFSQNAQQIAEEAITASGGLPDEYVVNPIDEQNGGGLAARDREWDVNIDKLFDNPRRRRSGAKFVRSLWTSFRRSFVARFQDGQETYCRAQWSAPIHTETVQLAAPNLNVTTIDQAPRFRDCLGVVVTDQRLKACEMAVEANGVSPVLSHLGLTSMDQLCYFRR